MIACHINALGALTPRSLLVSALAEGLPLEEALLAWSLLSVLGRRLSVIQSKGAFCAV